MSTQWNLREPLPLGRLVESNIGVGDGFVWESLVVAAKGGQQFACLAGEPSQARVREDVLHVWIRFRPKNRPEVARRRPG
jgi:hypothetical protein